MSKSRKNKAPHTATAEVTSKRVEEELTLIEFLSRESGLDDLPSTYASGWALKPSRLQTVEDKEPNRLAIRLRAERVAADAGIEQFQFLREDLQKKLVMAVKDGRARVYGHKGISRVELPAHALSTFKPEGLKFHKNEIGIYADVIVEVIALTRHQRIVRFIEDYCANGEPKTKGYFVPDIQDAVDREFGGVSNTAFRAAFSEAAVDPAISKSGPGSNKDTS